MNNSDLPTFSAPASATRQPSRAAGALERDDLRPPLARGDRARLDK